LGEAAIGSIAAFFVPMRVEVGRFQVVIYHTPTFSPHII